MRGLAFSCVLVVASTAALVAVPSSADAAPRMVKGPYLQDLAPTSITVMWQLDEQVPAKLVVEGPGGPKTIDVPADHIAEARIDGLTPSSRYRYRVEIGDAHWDGEFATAPPVGKDVPFSFIVVGDSRDGIEQHRRIVERMSQEVPDFILGTGDMVDEGFRQDQWQQFFDVENATLRDNVYFPALGNHDRQGRGRTADTYRSYFSVPENGGETERYYAFTYAAARFIVLDSNEYSFALTDQTAWLERELASAREDATIKHIFIVMHHPPFSISLHGGNVDLRERWTPLFEKYQVTCVFSGHDHVYERAEHDGLRYFVSGGGGAPLYPRRPRPNPVDIEAVKKFERVLHYLRVSVTGNHIEVTAIRADGTTIESQSWTDGPETATPVIAAVPAAGAGHAPVIAPAPPKPATDDSDGHGMLFLVIGGALLVSGAAFVALKTLR